MYDVSDEDHIPFKVYINSDNIPDLTSSINNGRAKIRWNNMTDNDINKYCMLTEGCLHDIHVPTEAVGCRDTHCTNVDHFESLNKMYNDIVSSLIQAGEESSQTKKRAYINKPGWAEYVDSLYDTSREVRHMWVNAGKPRQGPVYDLHVKSKARFKYALRFIKNNENALRKEALAKKVTELNPEAFWREIKSINNCNTPLPSSIEGVSGEKEIVDLWRKHFCDLLNCVNNSSVDACEHDCDTPYDEIVVTVDEVTNAIKKLDINKACGSDGICSEHIKYADKALIPLLSLCFTSFFAHGFLPETMLSVVLVPVIKDKAGKISSKDNYRPIALASVFSKMIEVIILARIEIFLDTNWFQEEAWYRPVYICVKGNY